MKKVIIALAAVATVALASCSSRSHNALGASHGAGHCPSCAAY